MSVLTIRTEDEEGMQLLITLARRMGMEVEALQPTPPAEKMPPRKWAGSISKESALLLLKEVEDIRANEWERQF